MVATPGVVFFGATNELSLATFRALSVRDIAILAVIVTAQSAGGQGDRPPQQLHPAKSVGELPLINPYRQPTLIHAAWARGIPVFAVADAGHPALIELLAALQPEAACVACFPRRIPAGLISQLPLGFLNVHPSILPFYRGPAPLFWLFQKADFERRGVTVHQMDEGYDTGPIVRQERISFAAGSNQIEIERQCGELGGRLLYEALGVLSTGQRAIPQAGNATYHPWPQAADYTLNLDWSARHAFNFMRATSESGVIYPLANPGSKTGLVEALAFEKQGSQHAPVIVDGSIAHLQFKPGILTARIASLDMGS